MKPAADVSLVVGGGFYGCAIALHLKRRGFANVQLVEREPLLLSRASYSNQARVHNGCHYPRSFVTAYRSRINLPLFVRDYGFAVKTDFEMLYAIARKRSKVTPQQFERFMQEVGIEYQRAGVGYRRLFDPRSIAEVYVTEEFAFDARRLREHFGRELAAAGIPVHLNTEAVDIVPNQPLIEVQLNGPGGQRTERVAQLFNCTYATLNHSVARCRRLTPIKHELTEMVLVDVPTPLANVGVTVMDGPFFSCMPFPAESCHSFSHVRYTPHRHVIDEDGRADPAAELNTTGVQSRLHYMIAAAKQYLPCLNDLKYRRSMYEIKTVLVRNESDDGRPILFRREAEHPRLYSVLGGKIDNIYDILAKLDAELDQWQSPAPASSTLSLTA
jgi:glycine/D-amino acid oxidase-like deaminating enzyme